jgi:hypothetical protein
MTRVQLLTAAAVLIACGCTESSLGPENQVGAPSATPPQIQLPVITGTVVTESSRPSAVGLLLDWGELVELVGPEASRLAMLDGVKVQVRGTWTGPLLQPLPGDAASVFSVEEFLVLAVEGHPAMDGVLGQEEGRYYLDLTGGDDVFWFEDAPAEFDANIGKRIWVTGSMEDPPLRFGVIN